MMFSARKPYPKSWSAEISLRRSELENEIQLLRLMARFEKDPVIQNLQIELMKSLTQQMVIPPDELGMNLERLAR